MQVVLIRRAGSNFGSKKNCESFWSKNLFKLKQIGLEQGMIINFWGSLTYMRPTLHTKFRVRNKLCVKSNLGSKKFLVGRGGSTHWV